MTEKNWFVFKGDHHLGPFSGQELVDLLEQKELKESELVWCEGRSQWQPIREIGLFKKEDESELITLPVESSNAKEAEDIEQIEDSSEENLREAPLEFWLSQETFQLIEDREELNPLIKEDSLAFSEVAKEEVDLPIETPKGNETEVKKEANRFLFFLSLGLGLSGIFLALSFLSFFSQLNPSLSRLSLNAQEALKRVTKLPFKGQSRFRLATSRKGSSVYMATNYPHSARIFLTMTSLKGQILGHREVVMTGQALLKGGVAHFKEWEIKKGLAALAGQYEVEIHGYRVGIVSRLGDFFKRAKAPVSGRADLQYKGKILFYSGTQKEFSKQLKKFHLKVKKKKLIPLKDRVQRYQSFLALLTKLQILYKSSSTKSFSTGFFEKRYNKKIGPFLRDLIIDNNRLHINFLNAEPSSSKHYEDLMNFGKDIGDLAARMAKETVRLKERSSLHQLKKKFLGEAKQLEHKGVSLIRRLKVEMKSYQIF